MSRVNGRINEEFVKKLKPPEQGQQIYWDNKLPGFGVRISSGGAIAFVLNYSLSGKRRRYKIGRYPAWSAESARQKAKKLSTGVDDGVDPQDIKEQRETAPTFAELSKQYREYAETYKRPSSLRNDRSNINLLQAQWGEDKRLDDIRLLDIEKVRSSLKETPYRSNRVLALISHMLTKAVEWELLDQSPLKRGTVKKMLYHEDPKERWLTTQERVKLMNALDAYNDQRAADAIRLLLFTGSRLSEVIKADWSQFDLKRCVWIKPSHSTKQREEEHVPLNDHALSVLKRLKPQTTGPLFPGAGGNGNSRVTIRRPWMQALCAAGLAEAIERPGKRRKKIIRYKPLVRIHDLRHTFASELVNKGVSLHLVGSLIGHRNPATTKRYAHASMDALRAAANQFGGKR